MLIITYAVFLVLAVIKFDVILDLAGQVLTSCRPLFLGFVFTLSEIHITTGFDFSIQPICKFVLQ